MYRIVLDTNILISALISKKATPHILYQAWWRYKLYSLITSTYQIREFERVVQYPKLQRFLKKDEVQTMINGLYDFAIIVEQIPHVNYSSDPDDNLILGTAIAGKANILVTGDKKDLLNLKKINNIAILTAKDAVEIMDIRF
ncbi:putative toxin-antitoxin system toxin component, PIN family [Geminocystis sp. GBBB08]|uniref:putative toxin-antitoxin system toxin component, PIN family n=1 Tax=Geminocystis sp. GBBB08 TaxID=2604140 RepID=UPI0027E2E0B2|nr:putative toxin-antitoxin system toxin component, PIN family [Geminocystis sp. GBBB08]